MDKIINVGIIGFGMSAQVFHVPLLKSVEGFKLVKIFTSKANTKEFVKTKNQDIEVVNDLEMFFKDENMDVVIITTPNDTHYPLARKALLSGKHVVVEKPFTVTTKEADELIQLSKDKNKILTVFQNRRWDGDFLTVKKIIENNLIGELVEYEAHFDRFRNKVKDAWKEKDFSGSGILYDLGSHLIDQAVFLFGLPQKVTADIRKQRIEAKVDDSFEIIMDYENLKVTLKAGMLVRGQIPKFILLGQQGSFVKYGMDIQESDLREGKISTKIESWGKEPENTWGMLHSEINGLTLKGKVESVPGNYKAFYENVYGAILEKEELAVKAEEARNVIRIIETAIQSYNEERTMPF